MRHPRIVNLTDVFEICCDSFATVLDYCRGTDLECVLRERKQVPERDARALILQVARGLQYLNTAQVEIELGELESPASSWEKSNAMFVPHIQSLSRRNDVA